MMPNEPLAIHHLRVVNFDKRASKYKLVVNENNENGPADEKFEIINEKSKSKGSVVNEKSKNVPVKTNKQLHITKNEERICNSEKMIRASLKPDHRHNNNSKRRRHVRILNSDSTLTKYKCVFKVSKHKSNSGIFTMPSKRKVKKYKPKRKIDLDDLKRTLSHHSINRFMNKLQTISRHLVTPKSRKRVKERKCVHKRNDDIKVLFTRDTSKLKDPVIKASSSKRLQSFDDIFGFRKINSQISPLIYQQSSSSRCPRATRKKICAKLRRVYSCEHYPLKVLASYKTMSRHTESGFPVHRINLIEFPNENIKKVCWNDSESKKYDMCPKDRSLHTYPCPQKRLSGCGDIAAGTCPIVCTSGLKSSIQLEPSQPIEPCEPLYEGYQFPCKPCVGDVSKGKVGIKVVLKRFILGFFIFIWSPCILAILLFWLITYPLRPHWIRAKAEKIKFYTKCYNHHLQRLKCYVCQNRPGCWSSFVMWLLWRDQPVRATCRIPPNPKRKYTLYHTHSRGWVMKAQHVQTEESSLSCDRCLKTLREPHQRRSEFRRCGSYSPKPCRDYIRPECPNLVPRKEHRRSKLNPRRRSEGKPSKLDSKPQYCDRANCKPLKLWTTSATEALKRTGTDSQIQTRINADSRNRKTNTTNPVFNLKSLKRHNSSPTRNTPNTIRQRIVACWSKCQKDIVGTDRDAWPSDVECGQLYGSLTRKPCIWFFRCCPSVYEGFLTWKKGCQSCCYLILYVLSACVLCPPMLCCYMCCETIYECV